MSKAERDWNFEKSKFINYGVEPGGRSFQNAGGKVQFMDWWSRMSKTGTMGDPTKSTKERERRFSKPVLTGYFHLFGSLGIERSEKEQITIRVIREFQEMLN